MLTLPLRLTEPGGFIHLSLGEVHVCAEKSFKRDFNAVRTHTTGPLHRLSRLTSAQQRLCLGKTLSREPRVQIDDRDAHAATLPS